MQPKRFALDKHIAYINSLDDNKDFDYHIMAHLRLNGIYWGSTALFLLNKPLNRQSVLEQVMPCYKNGPFSGHKDHDPHILTTLSGIQILKMYNALDLIDTKLVMDYIKSMQNDDGSFQGDGWGETDTRFVYCAVASASLLGKLDELNIPKILEYLMRCQNFDGGFGSVPGAESHSGQSLNI